MKWSIVIFISTRAPVAMAMALPFRSLMGCNRASLCVDCAYVPDITKTKIIFELLCPADMKIVAINKCFANNEHPCSWEVLYVYKPDVQKVCTHEDAKNGFQEILKMVPANVSVKDCNKQLIGVPLKYRVQYTVDSCECDKRDFDLGNFMLKLSV